MQQPVWNTPAGSLGNFPSLAPLVYELDAEPKLPAVFVTYAIISGNLPNGLTMSTSGVISGTPTLISATSTNTFVVRVTDNYGNLTDRTFSITLSGSAIPYFTTPSGTLGSIDDSTWTEIQIEYANPISSNPVIIRKTQGLLPPGLEINEYGLIRGYASPPTININRPSVVTNAITTNSTDDTITCLSTVDFFPGRPIIFTGSTFGNIEPNQTYYIKNIINGTTFTISYVTNGSTVPQTDAVGYMTATLPGVTTGQPTNESYTFTLKLESPLGSVSQNYSINVINQNTPVSQGGPGRPPNSRPPTILNTRPETYNITQNVENYGYYLLPPDSNGDTYPLSTPAFMGSFSSDNVFEFHILGYDFDDNMLTYDFSTLPLGLVGDTDTGWVTGTPITADNSINQFGFSVSVYKQGHPEIASDTFNFSFKIRNDIVGDITWITPANMGTTLNGITSIEYVEATCDVPLQYRLVDGSGPLPPNLTLLPNGELAGVVSFQPTSTNKSVGSTTPFTFTVEAYSPIYPVVNSTKTFTLNVYQEFGVPFDTVYCKCTPSISDRYLLRTLLNDTALIPTDYLYRPEDSNFGKATSIIYDHAYGINASDLDAYIAAISQKNHYWRNITLGEINTAIARNELTDEIIYEVVYSSIVDNLVNYNELDRYVVEDQSNIITPQGESVSKEIYWPRRIPLFLGPWYDSSTSLFTSYISNNEVAEFYATATSASTNLVTCSSTNGLSVNDMIIFVGTTFGNIENDKTYFVVNILSGDKIQISETPSGSPLALDTASGLVMYNAWTPPANYYTSLTPGFARLLYPNSLPNMRQQIVDVLGQNYNYHLLPLWMTSQQKNGSTLGYTPAWVIAYCKPGVLVTTDTVTAGSFVVGQMYTIKSIGNTNFIAVGASSNTVGLTFTATSAGIGSGTAYLTNEMTYADFNKTGLTRENYKSYAEQLQFNIQNGWKNEVGQVQTLNTINFEIDRLTVNKSLTYNYDNTLSPATFTQLPGASPTPNPIDSKDFYVLFPRETILPDETQYKQ